MGYAYAAELAATGMALEDQLRIHLASNCYPPVPAVMVTVCVDAIGAMLEGDTGRRIELPAGVLWRGEDDAPASAICSGLRLDAWLEDDNY